MAGGLITRRAGRGRSRAGTYRPLSEINVTPFVDVMLVLLIVFMVAAPLLTVGVPVDLPKTSASPLPTDSEPLFVSVMPDGRLYVQETEVSLYNLVPLLVAITNSNPEARILVRGDRRNTYGRMLQVMGTISVAGFRKIGLVAEMPENLGADRRPAAP